MIDISNVSATHLWLAFCIQYTHLRKHNIQRNGWHFAATLYKIYTFNKAQHIWGNFGTLQPMSQQELWQWVHYSYGEELGLTSDDDADYVSMSAVDRIQFQMRIQREEKLSQQNTDAVTHHVDISSNKVISCRSLTSCAVLYVISFVWWNNSNKNEHSESTNIHQCQNLNQKWSRLWIRIFWLILSRCLSCLSQNVVDALSCRHQWFCQVQYKLVVDCMRNANKCPKIPCSAKKMKKVIRNAHADSDHHQKLTTSRGSPLAHACQVWSTSISAFISYTVYRMTDRTIT